MKTQVKTFNNATRDNEKSCNDFLNTIPNSCVIITPIYNTIIGGVIYVVVYTTND